ncbi:MAG: MlaD family protein [Chthoniobacterales bacterium]|jgi:paraquat-inducible protein B
MSGQPNYFKIGLFVIAAFLLLAAALIYLGADRMLRPKIYLETYVDGTVQGVDVGSPVKFRGVQIGRISRIDFVFNEYGPEPDREGRNDYVFLEMEVDRKLFSGMFTADLEPIIGEAVQQGLRVMLQPQGVTGLNFAELNYVPQPERTPPLKIWWTPRTHYIPSAPGTLTSMLDSVNRIMDTFGSLDVAETLKELNTVMQNFNTALGKLQTNLDEMNLAEASGNLQQLIDEMRTKVGELPVEQLSEDGREMMATVSAAAGEMQGLVDRLEDSPLLNERAVGGIIRDFQSTAANFRVLSENLRDTPSLILWGKPPKRTVIEPRSRQ